MRVGAFVVFTLFLLVKSVQADVLATATFDIDQHFFVVTTPNGTYNGTERLTVQVNDPGGALTGRYLFYNQVWTPSDVGKTVTETAAAFPETAAALAHLVDGENETVIPCEGIWRNTGGSSLHGLADITEQSAFFPSGGGPDFHDMNISDVKQTLNALLVSNDTLNGQPIVNVTANYTITIDGAAVAPEPSSLMALCSAGAVGLCSRRRR